MKKFTEYFGQELEIVNTNFFKSNYDLKACGLTIQSIKCVSAWGNKHEIEFDGKTWEITKPNIWSCNLVVREKGSETILAEIKASTFKSGSVINLQKGEKVNIVLNIWKSIFEIQNELGTTLVSYTRKKWYCSDVLVSLKLKTETIDKYPFLILLVYLSVLQKRQSAAAA